MKDKSRASNSFRSCCLRPECDKNEPSVHYLSSLHTDEFASQEEMKVREWAGNHRLLDLFFFVQSVVECESVGQKQRSVPRSGAGDSLCNGQRPSWPSHGGC